MMKSNFLCLDILFPDDAKNKEVSTKPIDYVAFDDVILAANAFLPSNQIEFRSNLSNIISFCH